MLSHPKAWPYKGQIYLKRFTEASWQKPPYTPSRMDTAILFVDDSGFTFMPDDGTPERKGGLDLLETLVLKEGWKVD